MKRYEFECKLLSDVVLNGTSATEGNLSILDYIPGSKFLGIAAGSLYDVTDAEKTLDIFHNGNVSFGDATQKINNLRVLKVPYSWFYKKGSNISDTIFLHHQMTPEVMREHRNSGIQLKQARNGYFTPEGDYSVMIDPNFSIKSAYDSDKRKAKDAQMFGYYSLPKGSMWRFELICEEAYTEELKTALSGIRRIGRSRSAQYGLIEIAFVKELPFEKNVVIPKGEFYMYAESNLCFYDAFGKNTSHPTIEQLQLPPESSINWEKSQIKTRLYQTWNSKRHNRDADRLIIEKGSVFVLNTNKPTDSSIYDKGTGSHRSEGFGRVLINPAFLLSKNEILDKRYEKFNESKENDTYLVKEGSQDKLLEGFLKKKHTAVKQVLEVDELVNNFVRDYQKVFKGISSSQWGQMRSYSKFASSEKVLLDLLFAPETGYFMHGKSEHTWRLKDRQKTLKEFIETKVPKGSKIEFSIKLSAELGKKNNTKTTLL